MGPKPKKRPAAARIPRKDAGEAEDKSDTSDSKKKQKSENTVDEHEHDRQEVANTSGGSVGDESAVGAVGDTSTSPQKEEATKVEPEPKPKSRQHKKRKTTAKAKPKPKTRQIRSKKKTDEGQNPFDQPPDDDQTTVTSFFAEKADNAGDVETKESEHGVESRGDQSSSSSSSSSSSPEHVDFRRALGEVEDEDGSLVLEDSPCIVRADQVRSRVQMFSFPSRHVQRLKKHWGPQSVERLSQHLGDATLVSLYSGLGGAEIACHLLGKGIGKVNGDTTQAGPLPEFLLACDYNTDCQKVLNSHTVSCHSRYFLELLFAIMNWKWNGIGIRNGIEIELI